MQLIQFQSTVNALKMHGTVENGCAEGKLKHEKHGFLPFFGLSYILRHLLVSFK